MSDIFKQIEESIQDSKAVEFDYDGKHRIFSITDSLVGATSVVLVGKEPNGDWKRFAVNKIENFTKSNQTHIALDEVGSSFI